MRIITAVFVALAIMLTGSPAQAIPAPDFTYTNAVVGQPVVFTATPASCDTGYCQFTWKHVNGTRYGAMIAEGPNKTQVSYTFTKPGNTAVSLMITWSTVTRGKYKSQSAIVTKYFTVA